MIWIVELLVAANGIRLAELLAAYAQLQGGDTQALPTRRSVSPIPMACTPMPQQGGLTMGCGNASTPAEDRSSWLTQQSLQLARSMSESSGSSAGFITPPCRSWQFHGGTRRCLSKGISSPGSQKK